MALKTFCLQHGMGGEAKVFAKRLLVDENHHLLYCMIAKSGSSSIKGELVKSSGFFIESRINETYGVHFPETLARHNLRTLNNYDKKNQRRRLENYWKFLVVRHPFDRLVSAYNDKMLLETEYNPWLKLFAAYKYRLRKSAKNLSYFRSLWPNGTAFSRLLQMKNRTQLMGRLMETRPDYLKWDPEDVRLLEVLSQTPVTFKEFVSLVLDYQNDVHWRTMFKCCEPCAVSYDYIGRMETFRLDYAAILQKLNAPADVLTSLRILRKNHWRSAVGPTSSSPNRCFHLARHLNEFESVDDIQVGRLLRMYENDFKAFGYWWDNTTHTAHVCA